MVAIRIKYDNFQCSLKNKKAINKGVKKCKTRWNIDSFIALGRTNQKYMLYHNELKQVNSKYKIIFYKLNKMINGLKSSKQAQIKEIKKFLKVQQS